MKVLAVSTSISPRLWDKGGFLCVAPVPWSSGKQPYLLILLNKWPAFMLSVGWNKKDRVRRYTIACEINVLFALLCRWWWRWWNDSQGTPWPSNSVFVLLLSHLWFKAIRLHHKKDFISAGWRDTVDFLANMISAATGGEVSGRDNNSKKGKFIKGCIGKIESERKTLLE